MFRSLKRFFIVVLALGLLTACARNEDKKGDQVKDEIVIRLGDEPSEGFDPILGWGSYGSPIFQSTLLRRTPSMEIEHDLATEYSVSEDGLTWKVTVRNDVKFSDGKPLTAEDVAFTFEEAKKAGSVVDLTNIDSTTVEGDVVTFSLKEPRSTFLSALVALGIVPKHAYSSTYGENPIGSGAYKLAQWDKEQQVILEPNPEYYGKKGQFKKVTIVFLEEDAAIAAAKAGNLDFTALPATTANQEIDGMKKVILDSIDNRGIAWPYPKAGNKTPGGLPYGDDVTSDVAIRKSVGLAVDRDELIKGVLNGYGKKASSIADGMPWYNSETEVNATSKMDEAKKLLDDAGWVVGDDGIRTKDGQRASFELMYPSSDSVRQSLVLALVDQIKPLGLDITPTGHGWDEITDKMHSTATLLGLGGYDPYEMYSIYNSTQAGEGWNNPTFYKNEKVDNYFAQALKARTEKEALDYWKKAQWDGETGLSALGDEAWTWLVNLDHIYFVREGIDIGDHKIQPHGHGWPVADNLMDWVWE